MKIFITGIAGFLGSHLAEELSALGHEVSGNDNLVGGEVYNVPKNVDFSFADCTDFCVMEKLLEGVDIVIHAAATAHEGLSVFSPSFITKNIFEASVTTISAAISNNVKRFVFCSSMARYGNQVAPFTEDMDPKPVDPYAIAKVAAEQVLQNLSETHGMEWNIAVPHNIIGPRQRYDDPFRNVLSIMLNRNLQDKPVYIYGDGEQVRCFSYVSECTDSLIKMALDPNITSEVINIGPDKGEITINRLAELVASETGCNLEPIHVADRPREVKISHCSSDKARRLLDYKPTITLQEAIRNTADEIRIRGTKEFDYTFPLEINSDITPDTWKKRLI